MGILDALIIDETDLDKALSIDVGFVDKYLVPNPIEISHNLSSYMDISLPDGCGHTKNYINSR